MTLTRFLDWSNIDTNGCALIGIGWILKSSKLSFSCSISNFPSSTRPELLAIFTAILAVPSNNFIRVYTDSQAAINKIT